MGREQNEPDEASAPVRAADGADVIHGMGLSSEIHGMGLSSEHDEGEVQEVDSREED